MDRHLCHHHHCHPLHALLPPIPPSLPSRAPPSPPLPSPLLLKYTSRNPTLLLLASYLHATSFSSCQHMGLELELLSAQLPPIRTTAAAAAAEVPEFEEVLCSTPTAAASVLRVPSVCPPAPRKPRPTKRKKNARCSGCYCGRRRSGRMPARWTAASFVAVPDDLAKVFVPRRPVPCRPPLDGKKIRVNVVG